MPSRRGLSAAVAATLVVLLLSPAAAQRRGRVREAARTTLPEVVSLSLEALALGPAAAPRRGAAWVVDLGRAAAPPPRSARVVHIENASHATGGEDSPSFHPARNLDVAIDASDRPAQIRASLLVCPGSELRVVRRLWLRDHLGDARWHDGAVMRSSVFIGGARPCGDLQFSAASPAAIHLGAHRVSVLRLASLRGVDELMRIGRAVPPPWGPEDTNVHALVTECLDGRLVTVFHDDRWKLLFMTRAGTQLVSDDASRLVEVTGTDQTVVPLLMCVDGRAAVLESICPAGARRCTWSLRTFSRC